MSWYTKVAWSEGLFLRPHHLQQNDRYHEHLLESRVRPTTPYPWGFSELEIDRDLAQQSKFALRRAAGIMPDGTPFSIPADSPLPPAIVVPEAAAGQIVWLSMPIASANTRETDDREAESAARFIIGAETFINSSSELRIEEEIDLAFPRLGFELRKTAKPGYIGLGIARIIEVRDKTIVFDEKFVPPVLLCHAHPVVEGWIDRAIGWIDNKLEELARYAADPTAGGGLQSVEYLVLQLLNRHIAVLKHLRSSSYVHPERLFQEFLRLVGELATFATAERRARTYPQYDQDDLENVFAPVMRDLQDFLSAQLGRRAIRLEIIQLRPERVFVADSRPVAVPQCDAGARGRGAPAAGRNPERLSASVQGRPQHQDERDRARQPAGRAAGASADAAAAYSGDHRSRLLLPGSKIAAVVRVQQGGIDRDALLGRLAGT